MKRVFDLFFGALGLVVLTPIFLAIAVLIKLDSRGPIFFRQERIGSGGRRFSTVLATRGSGESAGLERSLQ